MDLVKHFGEDALSRINNSEESIKEVVRNQQSAHYVAFQGKGRIRDTPWEYGPKEERQPLHAESVFLVNTQSMKHGYSGFEDQSGKPPAKYLTAWLDAFPPMPEEEWARGITYHFHAVCVSSPDPSIIGQTFIFEERRAFKAGFAELENACRARLRLGLSTKDEDILKRMYPLITLDWQEGIQGKYGLNNKAIIKLKYDDERAWVGFNDAVADAGGELPAEVEVMDDEVPARRRRK